MVNRRHTAWIALSLLFIQNKMFGCSLDKKELDDFQPHTEIRKDLNRDGIPDYFYLAGFEDKFNTCVYLGQKQGNKTVLKLVHEDKETYNPILDLNGDGSPKLLMANLMSVNSLWDVCPIDLIPKPVQEEATNMYKKWAKGFEEYNYTYDTPAIYPIFNLYLPYDVKVYAFGKNNLIDVTANMKDYLALKAKVIQAILSSPDITTECRALCQKTHSSMKQFIKE